MLYTFFVLIFVVLYGCLAANQQYIEMCEMDKPAKEQYPINTSNNIKQLCLFLL